MRLVDRPSRKPANRAASRREAMVKDPEFPLDPELIPDADKTSRVLKNINIVATVAGDVHTFEVNLNLQV